MRVTFAGTQIALGFPDGGTDAVQGFVLDEAKQEVQWVKPLRATDAKPLSRGNRQRSISGTVYPSPLSTLDAAMVARTTLYDSLPVVGTLAIQQGGSVTTWTGTVLQTCKTLKDVKGVAYAFELTFLPGGPGVVTGGEPTMGAEGGGSIGTES